MKAADRALIERNRHALVPVARTLSHAEWHGNREGHA